MFEFLKKKISDFAGKIKQSISKQPEEAQPPAQDLQKTQTPQAEQTSTIEPAQANIDETKTPSDLKREDVDSQIETNSSEINSIPSEQSQEEQSEEKSQTSAETEIDSETKTDFAQEKIDIAGEKTDPLQKISNVRKDTKRELKAKVGLGKKLASFIGGKIKIGEGEISDFFDEFELSLLEGDVEQQAALAIVNELRSRLVGREIARNIDVTEFVKNEVRASLEKIMDVPKIDILSFAKKPTVILFLGPNGAGKTTSIAKVASFLISHKKSVVLAAADTFRAASIEQLEAHAQKIGVKVIKHKYGSDPAAVAFDAIKSAQANSTDYVLTDTAGRQETNKNLLEELKKINRVAKPDLKFYVAEAYTGQALTQQSGEFDSAIGIDGFILTKIDTDTKGGGAISLIYSTKKPVVFIGTGQRYEDFIEFSPEFITSRIL